MFFILSKLITWLVMPTSLIAMVLILSIVVKKTKYKRIFLRLGVCLFLFFTNPFLANLIINLWEIAPTRFDEIKTTYKYGIVLTGITHPNHLPQDRIHFNKGADRIVHAIALYKKGIIEQLLITGGSGLMLSKGQKESQVLKDFALQCGVPNSAIIVDNQARNTAENAQYSKKLLPSFATDQYLLITSAFHMRRAKACFEKVGFNIVPFPTDYYGEEIYLTPNKIIIPNVENLQKWHLLVKEWVGLLAYRVIGYI